MAIPVRQHLAVIAELKDALRSRHSHSAALRRMSTNEEWVSDFTKAAAAEAEWCAAA